MVDRSYISSSKLLSKSMKSWSNLILKFFAFVTLLLLADFGMGKLFVAAKDLGLSRHPKDVWLKSSYAVEKMQSDVIIIGSSTASHNLIPSMMEDKTNLTTYNCGQDGCFFLYNACLINLILERLQPKLIIWDFNPHSLLTTEGSDEYQNMRYLSYYYGDTIVKNYIHGKDSKMQYYYLLNGYKYNSHFVYAFYPVFHNSATQKGYIPLNSQENINLAKTDIKWEGEWSNYKMAELKKVVNNCKQHGVKLMIVSSPYYANYDSSVRRYCDEFGSMLNKLDVEYINLLYTEPFNSEPSLFRDVAHLNTNGAEIMTDTINRTINMCSR